MVAAALACLTLLAAAPAHAEPTMATGLAEAEHGFLKVYDGAYHSMGLKADGTVWAWGGNWKGQLGDGTTTQRTSPVQISALTGTRHLSLGWAQSMAIKTDGTVWAWGDNAYGQLGDGTTTQRLNPVQITALTGARQLNLGAHHSMAIKTDGTVWAWGWNTNGQLGDGTTTQRLSPVQITALTGARQLALGEIHSMAIKADGTVWGWGDNEYGQLGDGSITDRLAPVQATALTGTRQIGLGHYHSMAIKADGSVWAWGNNGSGQLGDGSTTNRSSPVQITAMAGARQIALGLVHSLGIKADGTVWAWGNNASGQLGDGSTTQRLSPVQVTALTGSREVAAGGRHSMAIKADGTVWGTGDNAYGQLADGSTINRTSPVLSQFECGCGFVKVYAGGFHSMGVKADGTVWAWGWNIYGQLGDGTTTNRSTPVQITALTGARQLALGAYHSMAIKADGTVWAWGLNDFGQLGDGSTINRTSPVQVTGLTGARQLSLGSQHSMGIKSDGTVWAWGRNSYGQLGDGSTTTRLSPVQITTLTGARQLSLGGSHSMAIRGDGTVVAWGLNSSGQLGDGSTTNRLSPTQITSLTGARQLVLGGQDSMGIKADGTVWAWGFNAYGQLGDGSTTNRLTPVQITALTGSRELSLGAEHSLAIKADGTTWTWGNNASGQVGDGSTINRLTPVQITALAGSRRPSLGAFHSLAIKADGTTWAWGQNDSGQVGDGSTTNRLSPVQLTVQGCTPPVIIDNQAGDDAWRNANTATYDVDFTDTAGLTRFEIRIWSGSGQSGTLLQDWTEVSTLSGTSYTTNWSLPSSGWSAMVEGTNHVSVRVTNTGALSTTLVDAFHVRKDTTAPANPTTINDGTAADIEWVASTSSLSGNWGGATDAPSGIANYDWCFTTDNLNNCGATGLVASGASLAATSVTASSLALAQGTRYYACIRSRDIAGNVAVAYSCSNGQRPDTVSPGPPGAVNDGTGADIDNQTSSTALDANWTAATDSSPGVVADYEFCFATAASCAGTLVATGFTTGISRSATGLSLTTWTTYTSCVRSRDGAGNLSAWACSDGVTVDGVLTLSLAGYETVAMGIGVTGSTSHGETRATVTTDAPNGYTLALHDPDANGALYDGTSNIPWNGSGTVATPAAWTGIGLGISAFAGSATPARWCTGGQVNCTTQDDPDLLWAQLTGTSQTISGANAPVTNDTTRIPVRLTIPATQSAGTYSGTMTITSVALP